jgi:hypothetical protein
LALSTSWHLDAIFSHEVISRCVPDRRRSVQSADEISATSW